MSSSFQLPNTFTALAYTSGVCGVCCVFSLIFFSIAVRFEYNHLLAPRTSARPKEVLKNVFQRYHLPYGLSWIPWALGLSYRDLLEGIPMTGTRQKGQSGRFLKCNLDGIIVIKFHALLLKVALFATLLCCGIILPLNISSGCASLDSEQEICGNITMLDNYGKTTISHIPTLVKAERASNVNQLTDSFEYYFRYGSGATLRLITIVVVAWAIYLYTCYLIWNEWIENSALRRVYYLESDHFNKRKVETEDKYYFEQEEVQRELPTFLPNAELRDTVPPVALYSALYKMPLSDRVLSKEQQIKETIDMFDKCIPSPPGFSSSVAVVTVLPDPSLVTNAWRKWGRCATLTRRLKFIQSLIEEGQEGVVEEDTVRHQHERIRLDSVDGNSIFGQHERIRLDSVDGNSIFGPEQSDIFGPESLQLLEEDMEQREVYNIEYARNAACCPNGFCCENKILDADRETLRELEEETKDMLQRAKKELDLARNVEIALESGNESQPEKDQAQGEGNILNEALSSRLRINQSREISILSMMMDPEESHSYHSGRQQLRRRTETDLSNVADNGHMMSMPQIDLQIAITTPRSDIEAGPEKNWDLYSLASAHREWDIADAVALNSERPDLWDHRRYRKMASGKWDVRRYFALPLNCASIKEFFYRKKRHFVRPTEQQPYAVITFTSRQAAVTARQCMADGSGVERWSQVDKIPVPPLADAPTYNWLYCRGFCKPTTLTLSDSRKKGRHTTAIMFLVLFCLLYTVPLSATSTYFASSFKETFPKFNNNVNIDGLMSGILYTIFFSICPFIFKALANYGSGATSVQHAEYNALFYYWIFILVTAFAGQFLVSMATNAYISGFKVHNEAKVTLLKVAETLPLQQSVTWLNWIIVRFLFILPFNYLLSVNNFIFSMLGMKCCSRVLSGGGSGAIMPYRIYVDSSLVFLCIVALAPASPLLAPAGLLYFLVFTPILRWGHIFVYRPIYDGGGLRWPLLHHILISALVTSQVLLTALMLLKNAYGPSILAGFAVIPTLIFGNATRKRFLQPYEDSGLLQTSQLDSHSDRLKSNMKRREEFLRWLVDCHKASFIPICLAGKDNILTQEAASAVRSGDLSTRHGPGVYRRTSGQFTPMNRTSEEDLEALLN